MVWFEMTENDQTAIGLSAFSLNARALKVCLELTARSQELRIFETRVGEACVVDCGGSIRGGFGAGLGLARVCLSGLGDVRVVPGTMGDRSWPHVQVVTDQPVAACLASQYAGWQLSIGKFFAMGSGPMRAAAGKEALFDKIGHREKAEEVVGVLECRKPPTEEVVLAIADACGVSPAGVTLLYAPTASLAGTLQVVSRSVETALHKLVELGFDLSRVVSAIGTSPLPPPGRDDLASIGLTNDAILYGGRVALFVTGDDASLLELGKRVPSSASRDHGQPFSEIFARYGNDFYAVDPHLFSPAEVVFHNLETGLTAQFGRVDPRVLERSFGLVEA
jgi:methenyltetrahydromethanopterin cyclohydrolase